MNAWKNYYIQWYQYPNQLVKVPVNPPQPPPPPTSLSLSPRYPHTVEDRLSPGAVRGGLFASPAYIHFNILYPPEVSIKCN
jgi:hypothetical protein